MERKCKLSTFVGNYDQLTDQATDGQTGSLGRHAITTKYAAQQESYRYYQRLLKKRSMFNNKRNVLLICKSKRNGDAEPFRRSYE